MVYLERNFKFSTSADTINASQRQNFWRICSQARTELREWLYTPELNFYATEAELYIPITDPI